MKNFLVLLADSNQPTFIVKCESMKHCLETGQTIFYNGLLGSEESIVAVIPATATVIRQEFIEFR